MKYFNVYQLKCLNNVHLYKDVQGCHYYIYRGDELMGTDIWEDEAVRKFNEVIIYGRIQVNY